MQKEPFCNDCQTNRIWFKTRDHYLDLNDKDNQFSDFSNELEKLGLKVKCIDSKTINVTDPISNVWLKIVRHECGPEILVLEPFVRDIAKAVLVKVLVDGVINVFKKMVRKKAKKRKEKMVYNVIFEEHMLYFKTARNITRKSKPLNR